MHLAVQKLASGCTLCLIVKVADCIRLGWQALEEAGAEVELAEIWAAMDPNRYNWCAITPSLLEHAQAELPSGPVSDSNISPALIIPP